MAQPSFIATLSRKDFPQKRFEGHLAWRSTSENPTAFFEEGLSVSRPAFLKSSGRDRALALARECRIGFVFVTSFTSITELSESAS
jgi:hypothetical protein